MGSKKLTLAIKFIFWFIKKSRSFDPYYPDNCSSCRCWNWNWGRSDEQRNSEPSKAKLNIDADI